jgi:cholesterol oxidase
MRRVATFGGQRVSFEYSKPIDVLIEAREKAGRRERAFASEPVIAQTDVLIIGSGYGGSVAALRFAGMRRSDRKPLEVMVLERGREYKVGEFPNTLGELPGYVRYQSRDRESSVGDPDALFELRKGEDVDVLVGSGLGGTSLINANVAVQPDRSLFASAEWPRGFYDEKLESAFEEVREWLGVRDFDRTGRAKSKAFCQLSRSFGFRVEAAPVAITLNESGEPQRNSAGLSQPPCTGCGNCVTGCNVGAKNTLAMNLIPEAKRKGAAFYTGASVLSVGSIESRKRWRIRVRSTKSIGTALEKEVYCIDADHVVVAAGALGSTEILQRSKALGHLDCSDKLGDHFSTNGDGLAMSFGQKRRVEALGTEDFDADSSCGPTITSIVQGTLGAPTKRGRFTLEDGAVPASLVKVFGEIVTTGAMFSRLGHNALPGWFTEKDGGEYDPVAYNEEILDHCQVLLEMSDDGAVRKLSLHDGENLDDAMTFPTPPESVCERKRAHRMLDTIDKTLMKQDRQWGFDGGQYVANPAWRLLPVDADRVMAGTVPGKRSITVHPLGGCRMADSVTDGVVNAHGQVYRKDGSVHEGLYVMDGAVIPSALCTNPFLTIAAVAWRWCGEIVTRNEWLRRELGARKETEAKVPMVVRSPTERGSASLVIREQLVGRLECAPSTLEHGARLADRDGMILRLEVDPLDVHSAFSRRASNEFDVKASLYANPVPRESVEKTRTYGYASEELTDRHLVAEGKGKVSLLELDTTKSWDRVCRAWQAFRAYIVRRQSLFSLLWDGLRSVMTWKGLKQVFKGGVGLSAFLSVACMHASYRRFCYDLELDLTGDQPSGTISIRGKKRIRWRPDAPRIWESLIKLPVEIVVQADGARYRSDTELDVDLAYMLDEGLIQVGSSPNMVESVMSTIALGGFFFRSLLQSSLWEFGGPTYPKKKLEPETGPVALNTNRGPVHPVPHPVPIENVDGKSLDLRLLRYEGKAEDSPPLLLIHGLAQGSRIFSSPTMKNNMARYMWERNYDVWLLDYRLSNVFHGKEKVPLDGLTIDHLAEIDIPKAVKFVRQETGKRIHVFAHCVGAVATEMAILKGWLTSKQLASVCVNAIHPWIIPSPANIVRSKLATFLRTRITDEFLDPIIQDAGSVTPSQTLLDRIGFSLARIGEGETEKHPTTGWHKLAYAICDRMTYLYSRMWRHQNLEASLKHAWKDLVGPAPVDVVRQLYYLTERRRLLDDEGRNVYLRDGNITRYWHDIPTLFIHGDKSDVFNPYSAMRSAYRLRAVLEGKERNWTCRNVAVASKLIRNYGHMDVILAKNAHKDVFPHLDAFFEKASRWPQESLPLKALSATDETDLDRRNAPAAGEILRAAWMEDGKLFLRYWVEVSDLSTSENAEVVFHGFPDEAETPAPIWLDSKGETVERRYRWFDCEMSPADFREPVVQIRRPGARASDVPGAEPRCPPWLRRLVARHDGAGLESFNFLVGSCRYPGTPFERTRSDALFDRMRGVVAEEPIDALFLLGDQIYADAENDVFDASLWRDRYLLRYRSAFTTPHLADVLAGVPVHFALDDHEIIDNWSGDPPPARNGPKMLDRKLSRAIAHDQVEYAKTAALSYMSSAREQRPVGRSPQPPAGSLWYALDHEHEVPFPAFVMDTRSEREPRKLGSEAKMITDDQLCALKTWLLRASGLRDRPKFIFSGQIIAPLSRDYHLHPEIWRREDGFAGYPETLASIAELIVENRIENVVFVGGDLHISCCAKLTLRRKGGNENVSALQIVSSGLYSPLPFANARKQDYDWNTKNLIRAGAYEIEYDATLLSDSPSHFVRVMLDAVSAPSAWRFRIDAIDELRSSARTYSLPRAESMAEDVVIP